MQNRFAYIDVCKGLLIIFVVLGHLIWFVGKHDIANTFCNEIGVVFSYFITPYYMCAFFLITGYCSNFNKKFKSVFISSFKTIKIPAVSLTAICLIIQKILDGEGNLISYLHLGLIHSWYESLFWFLDALFLAKLLYWAINRWVNNEYAKGLLCLMLFVFTYFLNYLNLYPNYGYHRHALFFVMFIFIGNWLRKKNFIFEIKWILATLITYLLSTLFLFLGGYSTPSITGPLNVTSSDSIFFWLMLSFSGSITIVGICKLFDRNRVLQYIGKNSLVFYCFHLSFLKLSLGIKYLSDSYFFSLVYLLLILTVILGLCTLFSEMLNSKYGRYLLGKF